MSILTASAILRGQFLIDPEYVKSQLPVLLQMFKSQAPEFKNPELTPRSEIPRKFMMAAADSGVYRIYPFQSTDRLPSNSIALVDIIGPIFKYGGYCSYGAVNYNELLISLANSDRVKGIILNIDSPGGQVSGTGMLADTIRDVIKIKPVISVIQDGYAASAAYWLGGSAQECYLTRDASQVGSIGCYTTLIDYAGYFEQNGIIVREIYAPQSTDKNQETREALDNNDKPMKAVLEFLASDFIKGIKNARGGRLKMNGDEPFSGKMYFAKEAQALGLIDGVKSVPAVVTRINQLIKLTNK